MRLSPCSKRVLLAGRINAEGNEALAKLKFGRPFSEVDFDFRTEIDDQGELQNLSFKEAHIISTARHFMRV